LTRTRAEKELSNSVRPWLDIETPGGMSERAS
jgi:hypothetical protein